MFEMRFRGLLTHARISHYGKERQLVVFYSVREHPHCPTLWLPRQSLVDPKRGDGSRGDIEFFRLRGRTSIGKIERGLPEVRLEGVPRLTKIGNGVGRTPHYMIRRSAPRWANPVLMTLPKGELIIRGWYPEKAIFGRRDPQCLPEATAFVSDTNANVEIRIGHGRIVKLKRGSIVEVTNFPCGVTERGVADSLSPHIHVERSFFAERYAKVDDPRPAGEPCLMARRNLPSVVHAVVSVECSNTQFP